MIRIDRPALPDRTPPAAVVRAAQAARRGVGRVHDGMTLPLVRLLEQTTALVEVRATAAFARLGVADELGPDRRTAAELAPLVDADADPLDRLLRFLATVGVVDRDGDTFALTAVGDLLRRDHPQSMRPWILFQGSAWQWHAWEQLEAGLTRPDTTPFARAHGRDFFDHLNVDGDAGATFDAAMEATSGLQADLLVEALDLTGVGQVCDVGGGTGTMLATLLQAHPAMRGTLLDLPDVVARAAPVLEAHGVADRVDVVGGDMFAAIPTGADRYLLSAIVHDWPDDRATELLEQVRHALGTDGRAWVVELELPDHDGASLERAYDLLMLVLGGGRERTGADFAALYTAAGLTQVDDTVLANGWHVHELAPADAHQPVRATGQVRSTGRDRRWVEGDDEHACRLPDGRWLTWAEFGDPEGRPVVVVDGAGSRLQGRLARAVGALDGLRVLTPDRPGYFGSTPDPGATFRSVADDLANLLDHVGIDRAGVFALSGGTAFGCALAAAHPQRVATLGLLGPIAPLERVGGRTGMDTPSALGFWLGRHAPFAFGWMIGALRWQVRRDPVRAAKRFTDLRPPADQEVMRRPDVWPVLVESLPDVTQSPAAGAHEFDLMTRPWGFEPAGIDVPTHVWAGGVDSVHPPHHAEWLAGQIPNASLEIRDDVAIFGFLDDYPSILPQLAPH